MVWIERHHVLPMCHCLCCLHHFSGFQLAFNHSCLHHLMNPTLFSTSPRSTASSCRPRCAAIGRGGNVTDDPLCGGNPLTLSALNFILPMLPNPIAAATTCSLKSPATFLNPCPPHAATHLTCLLPAFRAASAAFTSWRMRCVAACPARSARCRIGCGSHG